MSASVASFHDQTPPYARRVHQHYSSSPPSSFGRAEGRCATAAPTLAHNTSESFRSSPFGYSTPAASGSWVAPLSARRSPPPPPAPAQTRPGSRQGIRSPSRPSGLPAPASDPQGARSRSIASNPPSHAGSNSASYSQQSHSTTDKRDFEAELFEGTFSSEDLQLNRAFIPPTSPTPKKARRPAYHYTPTTTASPTAASSSRTGEKDQGPQPRSGTSSQPSFNPTGVGGVRAPNRFTRSIAGTFGSDDSRSGGYSQSISTWDSILSSDFYALSAAVSTPNTELSASGTGLGADAKWLTGVGYDGVQSAQARGFSKATGGFRDSAPATLRGNEKAILIGTARSGHWVNHMVIRTRREHIAGRCAVLASCWRTRTLTTILCTGRYYVDPNLDVPDHATPLKTNSLNPTYRRPRSNSLVEGTPSLGRTSKRQDSQDSALFSQRGKRGSQARPWKPGATANETTCHALIDSKSGDIDIKLHVGGLGEETAKKALVDVRSKTGKVRVRLIELNGGRRVHLDVVTGKGMPHQLIEVPTPTESVTGDTEVFLPRSFSGPLHVHSVAGEITILPRLASTMEVVAAREDDALVMISPAPPTPWTFLSEDDSSSVEEPPVTPSEEGVPSGPLYGGQNVSSLTPISETGGPTTSHSNPRSRMGSPSPKPWAKHTAPEQEQGRISRNGRPISLPFDLNELRPYGVNGFGAGAQDWNGDFASVVSAKGNVVVGFVGEDVESGKKGLWKRFIGAFRGKK